MGSSPSAPAPPPPTYSCPTDYLLNFENTTQIFDVSGSKCPGTVCDDQETGTSHVINDCRCACRIDPNSGTAQGMNQTAGGVNNSVSTMYNSYLQKYNQELPFIDAQKKIVQLPAAVDSYNAMISAWTAYSNALTSFKQAVDTYYTIAGYARRASNSTWINAKTQLDNANNILVNPNYYTQKTTYINQKAAAEKAKAEADAKAAAEKAAAEKAAAEKADADALILNARLNESIKILIDAANTEETTFIKDAIAADKLSAAMPAYNAMIASWTTYKNAAQSLKEAIVTYGTIAGRDRIATNPTWVAAEKKALTAENTMKATTYLTDKPAYNTAKANSETANNAANNSLKTAQQTYMMDQANTITSAIKNEIASMAQPATQFGVVSQYNDMKTKWDAYDAAYDTVIGTMKTYLGIKEQVSALSEYNNIKNTLAQSIATAKSAYDTAKNTFNSALLAAQKAARATAWMGTNRPGCRNLISSSTSVNNIQCNDNEYIYGFKSTDDLYFYTCCTVPKGIVGAGGLPGFDGPQGAQGIRGLKGARGFEGPLGPQGPQGNRGEQGVKGEYIRGPQGPPGKKGKIGAIGPRGDSVELRKDIVIKQVPGQPGIKGSIGPQGPQGPQGAQGPMGSIGRPGRDGKDADEDEADMISSPFNRSTMQMLDISDRITNVLTKKVS